MAIETPMLGSDTATGDDGAVVAAMTPPGWYDHFMADYSAGVANTFMLYGNIFDWVGGTRRDITIAEFLNYRLWQSFDVVHYSPDQGITFPNAPLTELSARDRFLATFGMAPAPRSEAERLLASAGGRAAAPADDVNLPRAASEAIPMLVEFLERAGSEDAESINRRVAVVVERLDLIAPPADKGTMPQDARALLGMLHRLGTSRAIDRRGNVIFLLTPSLEEIHPDLRLSSSGARAIEVPPPAYADRLAYAEKVIAEKALALDELTVNDVAAQTAGLTRRHIEDIALRAKAGETAGLVTRALIRDRKAELIAIEFSEVLTVLEPDVTLEMVGGHELVKTALYRLLKAATSSDPRLRARMPLGVLFGGPAGTGKTFLAQALANALGWNCLEFDPSKVNGPFVGQSERLLARAMRGAEAFAPCVIIVDELDQRIKRVAGSAGGGGDQAAANQFGKMLEFIGDRTHRGRILIVGASNWPNRVDAALLRPGRLDWKIPVLPPDSAEDRLAIVGKLLSREGYEANADALSELGDTTDGWTPAELERLVNLALEMVDFDGLSLSTALTAARGRLKPTTREIREMSLAALSVCDDLALVPEKWRPFVAEPVPVEKVPDAPSAPASRTGRSVKL